MKRKGLSLLEILVSVVILSLVMLGLGNIFVGVRRYTRRSRSRITASQLGKFFLDPLQMDVRQDQWGSNCLSSEPTSGCPSAQSVSNVTYTPTFNITNVTGTALRRVRLRVNVTYD